MMTAQAPQPPDAGGRPCSSFTATKKRPEKRIVYIHWLQDFLAENHGGTGTTDYLVYHGLGDWLDHYCAANPGVSFGTAGSALLLETEDRRVPVGSSRQHR
jgi:hypothetical protein